MTHFALSTSLRAVALSLGLLSLAAPASAQCPPGAVRTLTDVSGEQWDFNRDGTVVNGSDGAFDGMARLYIGGASFESPSDTAMDTRGGRGFRVIVPVPGDPMLTAFRNYYVPADGAYVRYVDEFQNVSATSSRAVTVEYRTNTGYDGVGVSGSTLEVVTTSDGDTSLEATDRYFVLDNEFEQLIVPDGPFVETAPRASCQVFFGPGARTTPAAVSSGAGYSCGGMFGSDTSGATVRFTFSIPPGERMSLMHFAVQANRAGATSACSTIAALDVGLYADLDNDTRMQIINWNLPVDAGACTSAGSCASGFCVDGQCCNSACGGGNPNDCQACSRAAGAPANGVCAPAVSSHVCRGRAGTCDRIERCDGTSTACPADAFDTSDVVCRPAVTPCDLREVCTGTNPACPPDRLAFAGTICRAGTGSCEPSARCDGTTTVCPALETAPDGTLCDDTIPCTFSTCDRGLCVPTTGTCDDGDMCTTDMCMGSICTYTSMPGCVGGRDGGPDSGEMFTDGGEMDAGDPFMDFDANDPFFDANDPFFDGGEDFDGGPDFDGGEGMDSSVPRDADDDLVVSGGGCSCRVGGSTPPRASFVVLALVALGLVARRRR